MSSQQRRTVVPDASERAEDARLVVVKDGVVKARVSIAPFTRVAVCFGRVFTAEEHRQVFAGKDPWMQWTFVRTPQGARQGHVVTPGLPGGALDPLYDGVGAFPYFTEAPRDTEPECVYVLNYKKGRMEYWVGRRGAFAAQTLRLCYSPPKCAEYPVMYLMYGHLYRPRSVNELAAAQQYHVLEKMGGWNTGTSLTLFRKWAAAYDERKEVVPPLFQGMNERKFLGMNNTKKNPHVRHNREARSLADAYWGLKNNTTGAALIPNLHNNSVRKKQVFAPMKTQHIAGRIVRAIRMHMIRKRCLSNKALSDGEVLDVVPTFASLFGAKESSFNVKAPWYVNVLKLVNKMWYEGDWFTLTPERQNEMKAFGMNIKEAFNIEARYVENIARTKFPGFVQDTFQISDAEFGRRVVQDDETWAIALARAVLPTLCKKLLKRTSE